MRITLLAGTLRTGLAETARPTGQHQPPTTCSRACTRRSADTSSSSARVLANLPERRERVCDEPGLRPPGWSGGSSTVAVESSSLAEPTFVPTGFIVPLVLLGDQFRLEPLGPTHNDADYEAWSSSIDHIHATPGWESSAWPDRRTAADNLRDLQRHAGDFRNRKGFTYTVLEPQSDDVVGCVYIYPDRTGATDAHVQSWVRASRAELDSPLWRAVSDWLASEWPFEQVDYAPRDA